jgi:predicted Fe-Mo cluster-binding NifX family protein
MKIAVPVAGGLLCPHFGHCEQFALYEVDASANTIINTEFRTPPPHEPGVLPRWLSEIGATTIIAGGMGARAQQLFTQNNIQVVIGANAGDPQTVVEAFLAGTLSTGDNLCDH